MLRRRFDRRVLALVEVRGGERGRDDAKSACEARGWRVVDAYERGTGATAGVLTPEPGAWLLSVEIGLYGAVRRAERGAAWRVQRLARTASLEMYVRRAELLHADRELLPVWHAHTTAHRPAPPPRPAARAEVWAYRLARLRARELERWGRRDAGVLTTGTPSEARRLARAPRDAQSPGRAGLDVSAYDGRARTRTVPRREDDLNGRLVALLLWLVVTALLAVVARDGTGAGRAVAVVLAVAASGLALRSVVRIEGGQPRPAPLLGVAVFASAFVAAVTGLGESPGLTRGQMFVTVAAVGIGSGLWLLVRQWTWGEWLTVAVPVLATVVGSALLAAGSVKHALYADELGLSPGDLDVPGTWQSIAAVALLWDLYPILLVPAAYGFAKHFHYVRSELVGTVVTFVMLAGFVATAVGLVLESADRAARDTIAAAEQRTQPPAYFGVTPEWTCVQPVVPVGELPVQGGVLRPQRPYVSFGVAGGDVVLWDTATDGPLKLPADRVRLVPVDTPRAPCPASP
ncbi:NnrS multi-domain protein [Streptomyces phytohabitans]|uniref:NnrS multi-domain protein n=1 Tax=Streptomyces phytohabitans TaxID=1150371 RepID=UPI00345C2BB8